MNKELKEWIISLIIAVAAILLIRTFFFVQYQVSGDSMAPTFEDKERLIINKMSTWTNGLDRGDVIVFHANEEKDYIKRLVGLPGDKIEYKDDMLYVNGNAVEENYLKSNRELTANPMLTPDFSVKTLTHSGGKDTIPDGRYLVLGDNRDISLDSTKPELGLIESKSVVGKVSLRFWPLKSFETGFYESDFDEVNK
ncbi:signal peptidase I [Macrococcoides goetzii]|uniref:Signal peptidase I n=1 Tax=Macrococcoides goetzii TaxID=1891097 RepID=A0A2G5NS62_9STAP|nr:signal peptidase I [Macrococcus goetzii]RAI82893.1 signal peptidase I [Macrococcus goetzii]